MRAFCPGSERAYPKLAGARSLVCDECFHAVPLDAAGTLARHFPDGTTSAHRPRLFREPPRRMLASCGHPTPLPADFDLREARRATLGVFFENPHGDDWAARLTACIRAENEIAWALGL